MAYIVNLMFSDSKVAKGDRLFETLEEAVEMAQTLQASCERNGFDGVNVFFEEVDKSH